jgi:PIN domain nuclease of toxin-antitoxin system
MAARLLLDTHILLWLFGIEDGGGETRLSAAQRAALQNPEAAIFVSAASLWEIAIKTRIGRLRTDLARVIGNAAAAGYERLPIRDAHLAALAALPILPGHRDPFDHLLIAQAIAEDLTFLSLDRQASRYGVRVMA